MEQLEFKFDTQLLIDGHDLSEDAIHDYILEHFKGDCLLVVGDDTLIKIHLKIRIYKIVSLHLKL